VANPQAENGYTRIANEVMEALMKAKLNGTQSDLVMAVIRKTWGWRRKEGFISLTEFQKLTGRHRNLIARELSSLQKRNIIQQTHKPNLGRAAKWAFNKDWETWGSPPRVTPSRVTVTAEGDTFQGALESPPRVTQGVTAEVNLKKKEEKKLKKTIVVRVFDHWISNNLSCGLSEGRS